MVADARDLGFSDGTSKIPLDDAVIEKSHCERDMKMSQDPRKALFQVPLHPLDPHKYGLGIVGNWSSTPSKGVMYTRSLQNPSRRFLCTPEHNRDYDHRLSRPPRAKLQ